MRFWDYGNSFLLQSSKAGADILEIPGKKFKFPSYFENVMEYIYLDWDLVLLDGYVLVEILKIFKKQIKLLKKFL